MYLNYSTDLRLLLRHPVPALPVLSAGAGHKLRREHLPGVLLPALEHPTELTPGIQDL